MSTGLRMPPAPSRSEFDPKSLYDQAYFDIYRADVGSPQQKKRFAMYRQEFDRIQRYCQGGAVLDVGCGLGDFLTLFEAPSWSRHGIEVSDFAAREAAAKGIQVNRTDYPD